MEHNAKQKWEQLGCKVLTASRNELYLSMRFLDTAFSKLNYQMDQRTFYAGTDGETILFNPRFLTERYEYDRKLVNRSYLHMILHCLFCHMYQREERDEQLWNLSCDITTEYLIDSLEYPCIQKLMTNRREQLYEQLTDKLSVITAQGVYHQLANGLIPQSLLGSMELEFLVDDHQYWEHTGNSEDSDENKGSQDPQDKESDKDKENNNKDQENTAQDEQSLEQNQQDSKSQREQPNASREQSQQDWQEERERLETNMETFQKGIGNEHAMFSSSLRAANRTRYDYKEFLRKFAVLTENMTVDEDSFDYSFYTYGLSLYHNIPLIEALEYKEEFMISEFVIALDTSGSCSGETIQRFLRETYTILKNTESFSKKLKLHILQCDNEIQDDIVITSMEELNDCMDNFTVKGFGGTDFRPVFEYVEKLRSEKKLVNLKGLLYFTDGCGIFPGKPTDYKTAFVFLRQDYSDAEVPAWAMKLIIDPEDKLI